MLFQGGADFAYDSNLILEIFQKTVRWLHYCFQCLIFTCTTSNHRTRVLEDINLFEVSIQIKTFCTILFQK